ncbi:aldolase [Paenibacillus sp. JX-17]|uniref:Aldolase n=1 Tax=Paenibacillus lacisoli TaxID=3064525 RepID=A0ABT9CD95_9BACL|nr:aldolase [Paenibacillus sp. JX-17]MDO7907221.1 aldolase [Paenibacillus sp. JX-17]
MYVDQRTVYEAFGLIIDSSLPLPELRLSAAAPAESDVRVKVTDWEDPLWDGFPSAGPCHEAQQEVFKLQIPGAARFGVIKGKEILVAPAPDEDPDKTRLYILGTCLGVILMQRHLLPLHGSAIAVEGRAYAFVGDSGAGKSTLAQALIQAGHGLVSDDVIAVHWSADGMPYAEPAYPQQKLWEESLTAFGQETASLRSVFSRESKYAVPAAAFYEQRLPLAGIFELVPDSGGDTRLVQIPRLQGIHTIMRHTYRSRLITKLGKDQWHFGTSARLAGAIPVLQLHRGLNGFTADRMKHLVLQHIEQGKGNDIHEDRTTAGR